MLRDPSLIPLSHQHHNGLALCVLTRRSLAADASPENIAKLVQRVVDRYELELINHFEIEEQVLFPACAPMPLIDELVDPSGADLENPRRFRDRHPVPKNLHYAEGYCDSGIVSSHSSSCRLRTSTRPATRTDGSSPDRTRLHARVRPMPMMLATSSTL